MHTHDRLQVSPYAHRTQRTARPYNNMIFNEHLTAVKKHAHTMDITLRPTTRYVYTALAVDEGVKKNSQTSNLCPFRRRLDTPKPHSSGVVVAAAAHV